MLLNFETSKEFNAFIDQGFLDEAIHLRTEKREIGGVVKEMRIYRKGNECLTIALPNGKEIDGKEKE